MISDDLTRADQYSLGETWQRLVEFVEKAQQTTNLNNLPQEAVSFNRCRAYFSRYTGKEFADGRYEYHKKMADFQILLQGKENIYLYPCKLLTAEQEFDSKKDIGFCLEKPEPELVVTISAQRFALILPHEAHIPSLKTRDYSADIVKLVVKIPYDFLNIGE